MRWSIFVIGLVLLSQLSYSYPTHPYLMFNQADLPAIRSRAQTAGTPANQLWNLILTYQSNYYKPDAKAAELIGEYRIWENVYSLALAYKINQDASYLTQVRRILFQGYLSTSGLLNQPFPGADAWTGATRVVGLSLIYDLLFYDLAQWELDSIKKVIKSDVYHPQGVRAYAYNPYNYLYQSNHFAVAAQGLGIAAMTLDGDTSYPDAAADMIWAKRRLLTDPDSYLKRMYYSGACHEGVGYGFWGLDKLVFYMYVLNRWDGVDYFHQSDIESVLKVLPEWLAYEVLPTPRNPQFRYFNDINDSWRGFYNQNGFLTPLLILASKYQDGISQWVFNNTVQTIPYLLNNTAVAWNRSAVTPLLFTAFLIYDSSTAVEPSSRLLKERHFRERGLIYIRSSNQWADDNDIQFAIEGHQMINPTTQIYSWIHDQSDKNHFTLYAYRQDFIIDQGYSYGTDGPEYHNYVLIDGQGEAKNPYIFTFPPYPGGPYYSLVSSESLYLATSSSQSFIHGDAKRAFNYLYGDGWRCSSDPTNPYCLQDAMDPNVGSFIHPLQNADRYVNFIRSGDSLPDYVVIADDIQKDQNTHSFEWRAHTLGTITDGNPYILSGNENSSNKLYLYYYDTTPPTIARSSTQSVLPSQTDMVYSSQAPEGNAQVTQMHFTKSNVTNPYFHFLLLPTKSGISPPTSVNSITTVANASILKATWSRHDDYSIFKTAGNISSTLVTTDAKLSSVRLNSSTSLIERYSMGKGTSLSFNGTELVNLFGQFASVAFSNSIVEFTGSVGFFRAYAPNATSVKLNGQEIGFIQIGDYVEFHGNVYVSEGKMLTLTDNMTLTIHAGDTLFVDGTLQMNGNVTITGSGVIKVGYPGSFIISSNATATLNAIRLIAISTSGTVSVQSGGTLRVMPNTILSFEEGTVALTVYGKLVANGTPSQRIVFTSSAAVKAPGDWAGILCSGGGPDTLTYCDINYAETGLLLQNTAANSYMQNDTIRYSSYWGSGLTVSNTGTANRSLRMYKCGINSNDGIGLKVGNAKVSVSYSRIENNGLQSISEGVLIYAAARVFFDSSRIQNNIGSGIKISGTGSRALLTPDSLKTGYNTVTQHGVSELWLTSSGSAFLGGGYAPGAYGGLNNVYNTFNYTCRLINNSTTNQVSAKWTYWGTAGNRFCGPVDSSNPQGSPVNTPSLMRYHDPGEGPMAIAEPLTNLSDWLIQLKGDITNNNDNSFDALHHLANFAGPGGAYQGVAGSSWEDFLKATINKSTIPSVKSLATALLVQSNLEGGRLANTLSSVDDLLEKKVDPDLSFFLQTRKVFAHVGLGDLPAAQEVLSQIEATASLTDSDAVKAMMEYVAIASKSAQQVGSPVRLVKNSNSKLNQIPGVYSLSQNFPNPFNPTTSFRYQLMNDGQVTLKIYDVLGREIATVVNELKKAGEHVATWDATGCSSGIYFYKLQAGTFTDVKKMLLVQ